MSDEPPRKRRKRSKTMGLLLGHVVMSDNPRTGWPAGLKPIIYVANAEQAQSVLQEHLREVTEDPEATVDAWKLTPSQSKRLSRGDVLYAPFPARAEGKSVIVWASVYRAPEEQEKAR